MTVTSPFAISIHAPRTGSDATPAAGAPPEQVISIHAPRTGSDVGNLRRADSALLFQSTLPARGATVSHPFLFISGNNFNPRSPHGERQCSFPQRLSRRLFQSTLPARGATLVQWGNLRHVPISIHAPRTGSDLRELHGVLGADISIHAPRTGSDKTTITDRKVAK